MKRIFVAEAYSIITRVDVGSVCIASVDIGIAQQQHTRKARVRHKINPAIEFRSAEDNGFHSETPFRGSGW